MLPDAASIQIIVLITSLFFLLLGFYRSIFAAISYFIALTCKLGEMYEILGEIRYELLCAIIAYVIILLKGQGIKNILPNNSRLNKLLFIIFFVGMISVPQAIDVEASWNKGGYVLIKLVLFYGMVVMSINSKKDLEILIWAFILITAWIAYEPVVNYISGKVLTEYFGTIAVGRFGAAVGHVALANTLNQAIPFVISFALVQKDSTLKKILLYSILVLLILGVIFTKSRGGFIGFIVIAFGFLYISQNKFKTMAIIGFIFIGVVVVGGNRYLSHMETISQGIHASRSSSDRYIGLVNGISMMIKRPLLGVGIGCYPEARLHYFSYYFYSHNLYGELFGELGLCSFFWFYWIYSILKKISQLKANISRHKDKIFFSAILIGIQISLFFRLVIGNFTHGAFFWYWFLMAAMVVGIERVLRNSEENQKTAQNLNFIDTDSYEISRNHS